MLHHWGTLTFLHWRYDPADVQALLPPGLTVEQYDGTAWVGLVPFLMTVRGVARFPETNVRTYVAGPDGRTGVFFLSLDAANLSAVVTARTTLNLPYQWAWMRAGRQAARARYVSRRRWPGPPAHSRVEVEVGEPRDDLQELDHYLTARFALWTSLRNGPVRMDAHHAPWALRHASVRELDDTLVTAAGLPRPEGDPLVHYSDGVSVRIGAPRR